MAVIGSTITHGITIATGGTYGSPLTVGNTGTVIGGVGVYGPTGQAWTVDNYGLVSGTGTIGFGVVLGDGGLVANGADGTIHSTFEGIEILGAPGTVINAGTIFGGAIVPESINQSGSVVGEGIELTDGGIIINGASGATAAQIYGPEYGIVFDRTGLVENQATIASYGFGIYLKTGGTIVNGSSDVPGAVISGFKANAVIARGTAAVVNYGTIQAGHYYSHYDAQGKNTVALEFGGVVINGVSGDTKALIDNPNADGIQSLRGPSTVTNYGTIVGGYAGIEFADKDGLVTNAGLVTAIDRAILLHEGGTVVDSGTIVGGHQALVGTAIAFAGTNASRLVLQPGYVISGSVVASFYPGATNTLELAASATLSSLTGVGYKFVNFGTITVDAGASWELVDNNILDAGLDVNGTGIAVDVTINGSGTLVNAGSMTGSSELIVDSAKLFNDSYMGKNITLVNGGYLNNVGTIVASGYGAYGGLDPVTVINTGLITAGSVGVSLLGGGRIVNSVGGVISGAAGVGGGTGVETLSNYGTISGRLLGVGFEGDGNVVNGGKGTTEALIESTGTVGVFIGIEGTVVNYGTIQSLIGVLINDVGVIDNGASGFISGRAGILIGTNGTVVNSGSISSYNYGVALIKGGTVINFGSITSNNTGIVQNFGTIPDGNDAVVLTEGGLVTNSGFIGGGYGVTIDILAGRVLNSGTIINTSNGTPGAAVTLGNGGYIANTGSAALIAGPDYAIIVKTSTGTVNNTGTIVATATQVSAGLGSFAVDLRYGGLVVNGAAAALITAGETGIVVSGAAGTVSNAGTITDTAQAGPLFSDNAGVQLLAGGNVANIGSAALIEGQDYGVRIAGAGSVGNAGTIFSSDYGIYLGEGGTVSNSGTAALIAGFSSYGVKIANSAGTADNTGTITSHYGPGIDLFDGGDVSNGTNAATSALITGDDAIIVKSGAATVDNYATIGGGGGFGAGIVLYGGGRVTNHGAASRITGGKYAVGFRSALGTVINAGTIVATTLNISGGLVSDGVNLLSGGIVINDGAAALISGAEYGIYAGATATVANNGTIVAPGATALGGGAFGVGVGLRTGSTVVNGASGAAAALIAGAAYGVRTGAGTIASTVTNYGSIVATGTGGESDGIGFIGGGYVVNGASGATAALISGENAGIVIQFGGSVNNFGTIVGNGRYGNYGVFLQSGGNIVNGAPTALIAGSLYGVVVQRAAGTITNDGTILGTSGGVYLGRGGYLLNSASGVIDGGVAIAHGAATVVDAGLIEAAGTAVYLRSGGNRLVLDPGYQLSGAVVVSGIGNTLELAFGSAAGTLNGLGTRFTDFAAVAVDSGSTWTLSAANTVTSGVTLTNAGTLDLADALDIEEATFSNSGYVSGTVTAGPAGYIDNGGIIVGSPGIVTSNGTIVDRGTIVGSSGVAVLFSGGDTNLLVLESGYKLDGTVIGAAGASATVELVGTLGDPVTASYNSLALGDFQTVLFGSGGAARLDVSNARSTLPVTIAGFTATTDVIDLTNIGTNGTISSVDTLANSVTVTGSLGSVTLQFSGTNLADLTAHPDGGDDVAVKLVSPRGDFAGSGVSDILWQNDDSQLALWTMNGASVTAIDVPLYQGNPDAPSAAVGSIAGIGDLSGDGKADILWRSANGALTLWTMNGATVMASQQIMQDGTIVSQGSAWSVAGIGHFNGDGNPEGVLWRNTNGAFDSWSLNGATVTASQQVTFDGEPDTPNATWSVVGTGDFNGDGITDVLWRSTTSGTLAVWTMDGATVTASQAVTIDTGGSIDAPDSTWQVAGIGDFTGNGLDDVLWRNSTSDELAVWTMNGASVISSRPVTFAGGLDEPDATWFVAGIGDYTGIGHDDVLWRNTSGALALWTMNGATVTSSQLVTEASQSIAPDNTWHVKT